MGGILTAGTDEIQSHRGDQSSRIIFEREGDVSINIVAFPFKAGEHEDPEGYTS